MPSLVLQTKTATIIAIVAVRRILPARWDTPDGRRPADPGAGPPYHGIVTPVLVEVEQYLKGTQPQHQLLLAVQGGVVGPDRSCPGMVDGYYMDTFTEGERAVVFLPRADWQLPSLNGMTLWSVPYNYTISPEQLVTVRERDSFGRRTIPLQQLIDEVGEAQKRP